MDSSQVHFKLVNELSFIVPDATFAEGEKVVVFHPLSKIWAGVRKQIAKQYGVDVAAWFKPLPNGKTSIHYDLSFTELPEGMTKEAYKRIFWTTSPFWTNYFLEVICKFVDDKEYGFDAYLRLVESCGDGLENMTVLDEFFDRFLIAAGVKKAKRSKKSKKSAEDSSDA